MPSSPQPTVYDSSGRDRISLYAWKVMFRELWEYRELIHRLVVRNFAAQFRQSFLGYAWIIFPPIATALVFTLLRRAQIVNIPMEGRTIPYALFALIGVTVWGVFTQFVMSAMTSVSGGGSLVSKIYFPREVLVLSGAGGALINSLIRIGVIVLTCALVGFMPAWQAIFAPLLLLPVLALALGLGLFLAPINTMMSDASRAMEFIFQFGMLLAPTVYPTPNLMAAETTSAQVLYWVHSVNPVSHTIYAVLDLVEYGHFTVTPGLIGSTIISFLALALGWRFFHICEPLLAERL